MEWTGGDLGVAFYLPTLPRHLPQPLDEHELKRVTTVVPSGVELDVAALRDRALAAFLVSAECRISEALRLDRADWGEYAVIVRGKGRVAKLHQHRFRHEAGTIVREELGDPRLAAGYLGHHGLGLMAGYTEVSRYRRAEAGEALRRRGV